MTHRHMGGAPGGFDAAHRALRDLVMAATVRIHRTDVGYAPDGPGTFLGSGFFIAPNWVLTCAHVVHGGEGGDLVVVYQSGPEQGASVVPGEVAATLPERFDPPVTGSWPAPDLALVRLREPAGHDCVYVSERPTAYYSEGKVLYAGWTVVGGQLQILDGPIEVQGTIGGWTTGVQMRLGHNDLPPGVSGGPVIDPVRGEVIGVLKSRADHGQGGTSTGIERLRTLPVPQGAVTAEHDDVYQAVFHAHDRYHRDRQLPRDSRRPTWADAQSRLKARPGRTLSPGERTELLGRLAALPPPASTRSLLDIVDALPTGQDPHLLPAPRGWRDGLGMLYENTRDDGALKLVLDYAMGVLRAERPPTPSWLDAERVLWEWIRQAAAGLDSGYGSSLARQWAEWSGLRRRQRTQGGRGGAGSAADLRGLGQGQGWGQGQGQGPGEGHGLGQGQGQGRSATAYPWPGNVPPPPGATQPSTAPGPYPPAGDPHRDRSHAPGAPGGDQDRPASPDADTRPLAPGAAVGDQNRLASSEVGIRPYVSGGPGGDQGRSDTRAHTPGAAVGDQERLASPEAGIRPYASGAPGGDQDRSALPEADSQPYALGSAGGDQNRLASSEVDSQPYASGGPDGDQDRPVLPEAHTQPYAPGTAVGGQDRPASPETDTRPHTPTTTAGGHRRSQVPGGAARDHSRVAPPRLSVLLEVLRRGWEPDRCDWSVSVARTDGEVLRLYEAERTPLDLLPVQVAEPLTEAFRRCDEPDRPAPLQAALPHLLLALPVDAWQLRPGESPLGVQRPVVVRCSDRDQLPDDYGGDPSDGEEYHERRDRWRWLHAHDARAEVLDCDEGIRQPVPDVADLRGLARRAVPVLCRYGDHRWEDDAAALVRIVHAGFGVALWRRWPGQPDALCGEFHRGARQAVDDGISTELLPDVVHAMRTKLRAGLTEAFWADGIALYYDDPHDPLPGTGDLLEAP